MPTMRILVTGGAGFIGSHIADALLEGGHEVRVLDSLASGVHSAPPGYLDPAAELLEADVGDARAVRLALDGVDAVCHQAAKVGLGEDVTEIVAYARANDLGTANLLEQMAAASFAGRLVLASSMVVYGEGGYACTRHGIVRRAAPRRPEDLREGRFDPRCQRCGLPLIPQAVTEAAPLDPRNVYAATKVHQEHLCFSFARETGVPVTALRYHNVYGPRMPRNTPYAGVAAIFASAVAAGAPPQVYEDGRQLRDFVHVRDVARANVIALTGDQPAPGEFNIASGSPRSVGELAQAMVATAPAAAPAPVITGRYRLGDVRHVFAHPGKAAAELGFVAREDFAAAVAEFAQSRLRSAA